jgi:hypothetical protein
MPLSTKVNWSGLVRGCGCSEKVCDDGQCLGEVGAATQALLAGDGRTTESGALLVERKQPSQVTAKAAYWVLLSVQRLAACCLVGSG